MNNIPKTLYRGITLNYNEAKTFNYKGSDITNISDSLIDKEGRRTDKFGNEYGIYMSDNFEVAKSYGDPTGGTRINKDIKINDKDICIPDVGIVYIIDSTGMNIKNPFINQDIISSYNNGMQGDEYITNIIPKENYDLYRVRIGSDILHDALDINLNTPDINKEVTNELNEREERLKVLESDVENLSQNTRTFLTDNASLRAMYGKDGLIYVDPSAIDTTTVKGLTTYLGSIVAKQSRSSLNTKALRSIEYINSLNKSSDINELINTLMMDITKLKKEKLKREKSGLLPENNIYQKRLNILTNYLKIMSDRLKYDEKLEHSSHQKR